MESGNYTIGEFSRLLGVSPRTVDFYTRQGSFIPSNRPRAMGTAIIRKGTATA